MVAFPFCIYCGFIVISGVRCASITETTNSGIPRSIIESYSIPILGWCVVSVFPLNFLALNAVGTSSMAEDLIVCEITF